MKLIALNIWGGKLEELLLDFLKKHNDVDVFCFQEVFNAQKEVVEEKGRSINIYSKIGDVLWDYQGFFYESAKYEFNNIKASSGLAIFVKKDLEIKGQGCYEIFTPFEKIDLPEEIGLHNRLLQYVTVFNNKKPLTIFNFHGIYTGGGKDDVPVRVTQSKRVKKHLNDQGGNKIIIGDFNLNPETKSLAMIGKGLVNLIEKYKITCTRSSYYRNLASHTHFADYAFISPEIMVNNFFVLPDEVSDHLPLFLEFE